MARAIGPASWIAAGSVSISIQADLISAVFGNKQFNMETLTSQYSPWLDSLIPTFTAAQEKTVTIDPHTCAVMIVAPSGNTVLWRVGFVTGALNGIPMHPNGFFFCTQDTTSGGTPIGTLYVNSAAAITGQFRVLQW